MRRCASVIICTLLALSTIGAVAQSGKKDSVEFDFAKELDKMFSTKINMDIDTLLFDTRQGNFYISGEGAMLMPMLIPQPISELTEDFKKSAKDKMKVLETKSFTHNGKKILLQKGLITKDGTKAIIYLYAVEATAESSIMVTGSHKKGDEKKFASAIERAALSAKLQ